MKTIKPTNSDMLIKVDDEDYPILSRFNWHLTKIKKAWYARGQVGRRRAYLHQIVMGSPIVFNAVVDHRNRDTLDNRKSNLHWVSVGKNAQNQGRKQKSDYVGVSYREGAKGRRWRAGIRKNKKSCTIGWFTTEIEAAKAYDEEYRKIYGNEFGCNFSEAQFS